jgi:hypothetical protein
MQTARLATVSPIQILNGFMKPCGGSELEALSLGGLLCPSVRSAPAALRVNPKAGHRCVTRLAKAASLCRDGCLALTHFWILANRTLGRNPLSSVYSLMRWSSRG